MENTLPKGWVKTEFANLIAHVIGGDWGKDSDVEDENFVEVYCIRGSEIKNWNTNFGDTSVVRKIKKSSLDSRRLINGDILLEISGGGPDQPVGRVVLITQNTFDRLPELPIVCTNFLRLIRPVSQINSNYFCSYLEYFYYSGEVVKYQGGSNNLRNLKYKEYETIQIPLPPLPEQERIVAKLDKLFAQHEKIKKALDRIPQLLKAFRQQVLTQAVTGRLTEQWREGKDLEEWDKRLVKEISTKLGSGSTPRGGSAKYLSEGIPLVRSMNVVFGGLKLDGLAFISEAQAAALKNVEIHFEDILLNITGASIGRLCLADKSVTGGRVNQHVFIIRADKEIVYPKFLESYLRSNLVQSFIEAVKYGAGMEAISKTQIGNLEICTPPLQEQHEIVRRVENLFTKADTIEARYLTLKAKIDSLPQSILHKAFKGELVPQLPTDGDAKDLLAEIMALKKEVKGKRSKT